MSDDPLRDEHEHLQRATREARAQRRTPAETAFVRELRATMEEYLKAREQGMAREDAVRGIEAELRARWPKRPSKFGDACDACDGTGWQAAYCSAQHRCGRPRCAEAHPAHEHRYVVPCACVKGDRFAGRTATPAPVASLAAVGKQRRKSGFSKVGR